MEYNGTYAHASEDSLSHQLHYSAAPAELMVREFSQGSNSSYDDCSPRTPVGTGNMSNYYYTVDQYRDYPQGVSESTYTKQEDTTWSHSQDMYNVPMIDDTEYTGDDYIVSPGADESGGASSGVIARTTDNNGMHVCLWKNCDAKPFKRKADLERHYRHRHKADDEKDQHLCDYHNCARNTEPFHRVDHCRDHYREFHKEDLVKKKGREDDEWYNTRLVSKRWWRCSKCLQRNRVSNGWDCTTKNCRSQCDAQRRGLRGSN